METITEKNDAVADAGVVDTSVATLPPALTEKKDIGSAQSSERGGGRRFGGGRKGGKPFNREARVRPEFDQKIITIRRVARVVAGGRRFSFSVAIIAGNRKGQVGVGLGKAGDTALAVDKAMRNAKKHMITVPITKTGSIPHRVEAKYSSARLFIMPAPGRGLVVGSAVRTVLELAGVKDATAKILSPSKNKLNIARCAIKALRELRPIKEKEVISFPPAPETTPAPTYAPVATK